MGSSRIRTPIAWYFRNQEFDCLRKGGETCFAKDGENQYHAILGNQGGCVIVHPSATAVALMALNAKLRIKSEKEERELSIDEFFVTPDQDITRENVLRENELITDIVLPPVGKDFTSFYFKQKEKQAFDWPIAETAVAYEVKGGKCRNARVVLGAAAPVPWRAEDAEKVLNGKAITVDIAKNAGTEAVKPAEPLSQNAHKIPIFKAIIYRTICWAGGVDPFA